LFSDHPTEVKVLSAIFWFAGVVHGDVKPDNIMVEVRPPQTFGAFALPFMKLIDFSNAMQLDETHAYHDSFDVATPSYRAPELVYGTKFGCPVDMWAAGITLAELFCGRTLITPDTRCGLAMQIAQLLGQPPPGIFERSRFAAELFACVADTPSTFGVQQMRQRFSGSLGASMCQEQQFFMDFLAKILRYDACSRLSPAEALCHPFLAPVFPFQWFAKGTYPLSEPNSNEKVVMMNDGAVNAKYPGDGRYSIVPT